MLRDPFHCPHCRCDLTGLYATWTDRCPLEVTCSECGKSFDVGRLRSPRHWPRAERHVERLPCPECGYNLAGIASSVRDTDLVTCSECGFACCVYDIRFRREVRVPADRSAVRFALLLLLAPVAVLLLIVLISFVFGLFLGLFR